MACRDVTRTEILYQNPQTSVKVYAGTYKNQPAAIKERIHANYTDANTALHEVFSQIQLDHDGICKIYDCFLEETDTGELKSVIVLERMETDLYKEMLRRGERREYWSEVELMEMMRRMLEALRYAESKGIAHRDVKPQNIFLHNSHLKLSDFEASTNTSLSLLSCSIQGSPFFLSPELKLKYLKSVQGEDDQTPYDPYKSDVYSLGITMVGLMLLKLPVEFANLAQLREKTEVVLAQCHMYPLLTGIIREMLETNPENRSDFSQLYSRITSLLPPSCENIPQIPQKCPNCGLNLPQNSLISANSCVCFSSLPKNFCPDCKKPLLRDDFGEIQGCNCSIFCVICQKPVQNSSEIRHFSDIGIVCSLNCMQKIGYFQCIWCDKIAKSAENEPKIVLNCGHEFHNLDCLASFLQLSSTEGRKLSSIKCPNCQSLVTLEVIKRYFRRDFSVARLDVKLCERCRHGVGLQLCEEGYICVECAEKSEQKPESCRTF